MALRFRHRGDCVRNALSTLSVRANVEQVKINTVNRVFDGSATPTLQRPTRRPEPTDLHQYEYAEGPHEIQIGDSPCRFKSISVELMQCSGYLKADMDRPQFVSVGDHDVNTAATLASVFVSARWEGLRIETYTWQLLSI